MAASSQSDKPVFCLRRIGSAATMPSVGDKFLIFSGESTLGRRLTIGCDEHSHRHHFYLDSSHLRCLISRQHARLMCMHRKESKKKLQPSSDASPATNGFHKNSEEEWVLHIQDCSLNGTFVNDVKVAGWVELQAGDTLTLGHPQGAALSMGCVARQPTSEFRFELDIYRPSVDGPVQTLAMDSSSTQPSYQGSPLFSQFDRTLCAGSDRSSQSSCLNTPQTPDSGAQPFGEGCSKSDGIAKTLFQARHPRTSASGSCSGSHVTVDHSPQNVRQPVACSPTEAAACSCKGKVAVEEIPSVKRQDSITPQSRRGEPPAMDGVAECFGAVLSDDFREVNRSHNKYQSIGCKVATQRSGIEDSGELQSIDSQASSPPSDDSSFLKNKQIQSSNQYKEDVLCTRTRYASSNSSDLGSDVLVNENRSCADGGCDNESVSSAGTFVFKLSVPSSPVSAVSLSSFSDVSLHSSAFDSTSSTEKPAKGKKRRKHHTWSSKKRRMPKLAMQGEDVEKCSLSRRKEYHEDGHRCAAVDCLRPGKENVLDWVQCDDCHLWYHFRCLGESSATTELQQSDFHCGCV